MKLKIKKLHPGATIPKTAYKGDAGFDLCTPEKVIIPPGARVSIPLGLSMEIPEGYVFLLFDKSGLSHKHGLKSFGGVIDSGYRGEFKTSLMNFGTEPYVLEAGDKVIQMLIVPVPAIEVEEVEELSPSERDIGGFGSSGK